MISGAGRLITVRSGKPLCYRIPDQLLASVNFIADHVIVYPALESLDAALKELQLLANLAKIELEHCAKSVRRSFAGRKFKTSYSDTFEPECVSLRDWLQGHATQRLYMTRSG